VLIAMSSACAGCVLASCLPGGSGGATGGIVDGGAASDFPVGDLAAVPGEGVAVGRDADGFYALSTICTHQGCDMASQGSVSTNGLFCACHGSRFDPNGVVLQGPAHQDLPHYAVTIDDQGTIQIDTDTEVSASDRTAEPSTGTA
jgi:Rieske Fe-S protein